MKLIIGETKIKESEDNSMKCDPLIPKQGKKILFFLVLINVIIIWLVYKKSNYSYFHQNSVHVVTDTVYYPLNNVPIFHVPLLHTKDMAPYYSEINSNTWCLKEGINLLKSKQHKKCVCLSHWFGLDCGIPSLIWKSEFMQEGKNAGIEIRRRDKPRRIIFSIVFEDAFDLLDINIQNSFSIVDIFLIAEKITHNESILSKIEKGNLAGYQNKIMPIQLKRNILNTHEYSRIVLMLKELWDIGWTKLSDFRPDDIFLFTHMSSILSKDALLFLKLYDGYPEPFNFTLRPLLFKFSKVLKNRKDGVVLVPFEPVGCTFQFIASMCDDSVSKFLEKGCITNKLKEESFEKQHWQVKQWKIGSTNFPSGWQCNFCCSTKCIFENIRVQKWLQVVNMSTFLNYTELNLFVIEQFLKRKTYYGTEIYYETINTSDVLSIPKEIINTKKFFYLLS